MCKKYVKSERD